MLSKSIRPKNMSSEKKKQMQQMIFCDKLFYVLEH
jgi:hypothetical protein